jgi:hypothetical protein
MSKSDESNIRRRDFMKVAIASIEGDRGVDSPGIGE